MSITPYRSLLLHLRRAKPLVEALAHNCRERGNEEEEAGALGWLRGLENLQSPNLQAFRSVNSLVEDLLGGVYPSQQVSTKILELAEIAAGVRGPNDAELTTLRRRVMKQRRELARLNRQVRLWNDGFREGVRRCPTFQEGAPNA